MRPKRRVTLSTADGDVRIPRIFGTASRTPRGRNPPRDGQYRVSGEDAVRKRQGGCLRGSARVACAGTAGRDVGQMLLHLPVRKSVRRSGVPGNVACTNDFRGTGKGTAASAAGDGACGTPGSGRAPMSAAVIAKRLPMAEFRKSPTDRFSRQFVREGSGGRRSLE